MMKLADGLHKPVLWGLGTRSKAMEAYIGVVSYVSEAEVASNNDIRVVGTSHCLLLSLRDPDDNPSLVDSRFDLMSKFYSTHMWGAEAPIERRCRMAKKGAVGEPQWLSGQGGRLPLGRTEFEYRRC